MQIKASSFTWQSWNASSRVIALPKGPCSFPQTKFSHPIIKPLFLIPLIHAILFLKSMHASWETNWLSNWPSLWLYSFSATQIVVALGGRLVVVVHKKISLMPDQICMWQHRQKLLPSSTLLDGTCIQHYKYNQVDKNILSEMAGISFWFLNKSYAMLKS